MGTISLNTPTGVLYWTDVNWQKVEENVRKLQCRIAKAVKDIKPRKVIKGLMRLLNNSLSARLLAVKKVVNNKGKKTAGVDGMKINSPDKKMDAVKWLKQNNNKSYAAKPLKRVFIPKKQKNSKKQKISLLNLLKGMNTSNHWRPLGIPTQLDRAMQALHKLSLEPVAETTADLNSYAYRPLRSAKDAIQQVFMVLGYKFSANWILEGDIRGCFDNISHKWVLENIPLCKHILKQWLKSGYTYENHWFESKSGTPQGGIISPVIANMVLDGLETNIKALKLNKCNFIRFADDFIVTCEDKQDLIEKVLPLIKEFFKERGLTLSDEKTKITHIEDGFDFLGFNVRKYKGKPLIKPSKKGVKNLKYKIKTVFKKLKSSATTELLKTLNPILRGWANYYDSEVSKDTFNLIDNHVWNKSVNYMKYRHNRKRYKHFYKKYFTKSDKHKVDVLFAQKKPNGIDKKPRIVKMFRLGEVKIKRHTKIKSAANIFDKTQEFYFEQRESKKWKGKNKFDHIEKQLRKKQYSECPFCRQMIYLSDKVEIHRKVFLTEGGKGNLENLVLLHEGCHLKLHGRNKVLSHVVEA